ncbi:MAG: hypothetical protein ISS34_05565 [Candidatus Omnitrophica bacterium]|nr:hypothetical protein [Candidatus Omnitrophota bacterium]
MKNIKPTRFLIIIFSALLVFAAGSFARPVTEKGDAVYRMGHIIGSGILGHAGLYDRYPGGGLDPDDLYSHFTYESLNRPGVGPENFGKFHDETFFWGVRTLRELDYSSRREIVKTARSQFGCKFGIFFSAYKKPASKPWVADGSFRCDGLVEYCYEVALGHSWMPGKNGGIVKNDDWWTLNPIRQRHDMHKRTASEEEALIPHTVQILTPSQDGEVITGEYELEAFTSDGTEGSGITRIEFWLGEPDDTPLERPGVLIGNPDEHDSVIGDRYYCTLLPTLDDDGEHTIYAKAFDQAGNVKISEGVDVVIDTLAMFTGIWIGKYSSWFDVPRWQPPGDYRMTIECWFYALNAEGGYDEVQADSFFFTTPTGILYTSDSEKLNLGFTKDEFETIFTEGAYEVTGSVTIDEKVYEIAETMQRDSSVAFLEIPLLTSTSPPNGSTVSPGSVDVTLRWRSIPGAEDYYVDLGSEGPPFVVYDYPGTSYTFQNVPIPFKCSIASWSVYISTEVKYTLPEDGPYPKFKLTLSSICWDEYYLKTPCPEE